VAEEAAVITAAQLLAVMPRAAPARWLGPLNAALAEYSVDAAPARVAMFLAQVAVETAGLTRLEELLDYSPERLIEVWPMRFDAVSAPLYAHRPQALADLVYADRMGNGDEASGDGWRYRGRGLLMLTGRGAYQAAGYSLGLELEYDPDRVAADPAAACRTAAWHWAVSGCNRLADAGQFEAVTRAVTGGRTGLPERQAAWQVAQGALA